MTSPTQTEEHQVPGANLVAKAKELLHEGNVRRLIVKNEQGQIVMEFPLTAGVLGAVLAPALAALGAIAALAAHYTLVVERRTAGAIGPAPATDRSPTAGPTDSAR
jgi:Domain of unknown function (DUF4342)